MKIICEGKRYDVDKLTDLEIPEEEIGTGLTLKNAWLTPSNKVIVETYSIWENPRTHACYGTSYHFASDDEIASLAHETGDERLMSLVPEGE